MRRASDFDAFAARKEREARHASIHRLVTIDDRSSRHPLDTVGTTWTRQLYDGPFHLVRTAAPAISLVFVQSRTGNTVTDRPEELGGGATDKHLLYEGLSRIAADAVLAGARTASGAHVFFSLWHPELVALRLSLGLARHPAQVVVTGRACIDPETSLVFNAPDVPAIVIGSTYACGVLASAAASRPWMHIVRMEDDDLAAALRRLPEEFGIRRISCIGGRTTATALLDAGIVQDVCLTTTARDGGEPGTPFYVGKKPPAMDPIVRKRGTDPDAPILFEHLAVRRAL